MKRYGLKKKKKLKEKVFIQFRSEKKACVRVFGQKNIFVGLSLVKARGWSPEKPGALALGMKTDRIRTDIIDITFVFIFLFGFGFEYR